MLRELHISNLALIEDLTIELAPGLNCFTGQTGAGKSLILGALEILLGLRQAGSDMIRPGTCEARINGLFTVQDPWIAQQIARVVDLSLQPGDDLLITRKLLASGRGSTCLNGQPITGTMMKSIAELLVDVHGQHDHQFLLRPSNQLWLLDGYAGTLELREEHARLHQKRRVLMRRRQELLAGGDLRRQQLELFEFQAAEIDKIAPRIGEYGPLHEKHARLSNVQKIQREAGSAHAALSESDGSVLDRLQVIAHVLASLAELDPRLEPIAQQIKNAAVLLQDGAYELLRYVDRLELDPQELAQIEDRLNDLHRLITKYGSKLTSAANANGTEDPLEPVLALRAHLEDQIRQLKCHDVDGSQLDQELAFLEKQLGELAERLTRARREAAGRLEPRVEEQLHELGMSEAKFEVEMTTVEACESGCDAVEMLVRANPGLPARPLRKVASGGELSRIMLALKTILAQSDRISVLVFDEIDANIGGRMGTVIGGKLRRLAQGDAGASATTPSQQVICITHLPQIAAFAHRHFRIAKEVSGAGRAKETRTQVTVLDGKQRVEELAEMLAGNQITSTTRKQVAEMLMAAQSED